MQAGVFGGMAPQNLRVSTTALRKNWVCSADPLYQHLLLTAERKFWRCVQSGEVPRLFGVEPPRPRLEAVRTVDMSGSNSWAELAATFRRTRPAYQEHEAAKASSKRSCRKTPKKPAVTG